MSVATGRAVVETVFRSASRYSFSRLQLKYSGGEPLLRFPVLLELQQAAFFLAREAQLELDAVVLSNGTLLTSAIVAAMLENHLRLMISMDCLDSSTDQLRMYADGRSSTDDVKRAVELAVGDGLIPHISVTVSGRNARTIPQFVDWLLAKHLPFNLNFYRENDFSLTETDLRLQEDEIIDSLLGAFAVIRANLPQRKLFSALVDRSNLAAPHRYPCGVGQNYLVFNPQGAISKCHMAQNEQAADLSAVDPLCSVREDSRGVQNPAVEDKAGCQECEWSYACAGGCPLLTYRKTGSFSRPSPNCGIYRAVFPEVLRLEGLRLLKYGSDTAIA